MGLKPTKESGFAILLIRLFQQAAKESQWLYQKLMFTPIIALKLCIG